MSSKWTPLKKKLALLSTGGCTFAFGLSNAVCISNEAVTGYYTTAGNAAVEALFDPARRIGSDFDAVVVTPTSNFVQSLWTTHVLTRIPQDPTFSTLLNE
jgi:hypothetical protein